MTELKDDQIDFDRVVTDPEYRRHVIVYLNAQARGRDVSRSRGPGAGRHQDAAA
jgi:hypothetical protein